jgi:hypothetical protein
MNRTVRGILLELAAIGFLIALGLFPLILAGCSRGDARDNRDATTSTTWAQCDGALEGGTEYAGCTGQLGPATCVVAGDATVYKPGEPGSPC